MTEREMIENLRVKLSSNGALFLLDHGEIDYLMWLLNKQSKAKQERKYEVVVTDEYGREHRSPLTKPFCVKYDGDSQTEEYHIFVRKEDKE